MKKYGSVLTDGTYLVEPRFGDAREFSEGLAVDDGSQTDDVGD